MRSCFIASLLFVCVLPPVTSMAQQAGEAAVTSSMSGQSSVMTAADAAKVIPPTVFFRGLSAPIQARNSGGVQFADKRLMLVALVDTSGYSTQVKEKYQAYLITETAIEIGGQRLAPGAYGCGFIADDKFVVQDVGAHDLLTAPSTRDTALLRPTPLQVMASPGMAGGYRLYAGRSYVTFHVAAGQSGQ